MSTKSQMRKVLRGLAPPPKPRLIDQKTDPKHMPMDFTTPVAEIVRRYDDESQRCSRWSSKMTTSDLRNIKKDAMQENLRKYMSRGGLELIGLTEWQSPINGDKWISFVLRKMFNTACVDLYSLPMYYWETIGNFGFAFKRDIPRADNVGDYNTSIWMFNTHCMQRFKERTGVTGTTINLMLFVYAVMEYSVGYVYNRSGKKQYEIATEFGVFRTEYQDKHLADHIKTFIAKDQLTEIDRKRYDKYWKVGKDKIFNNTDLFIKSTYEEARRREQMGGTAESRPNPPHATVRYQHERGLQISEICERQRLLDRVWHQPAVYWR